MGGVKAVLVPGYAAIGNCPDEPPSSKGLLSNPCTYWTYVVHAGLGIWALKTV